MAQANILLADNELDFLETRKEFLEKEGYRIIKASSPKEALAQLEQEELDLAVVDIRLVNDSDEKDISGLEVAKHISRSIPVIILTGYGAVNYVRQALSPQADGVSPAQDFITKEEGPEALITAVRRVLTITQSQAEIIEPDKKNILHNNLKPFVGLGFLMLALGSGIIATIYGDPRWLIGTVALATFAVLFMGLSE